MKTYAEMCKEIGIDMPPFVWGVSGVYSITCSCTGKMYIGCSSNIMKRLLSHTKRLRANKHSNKKLQSAWNKHGQKSFYACVIQYSENFYHEEKVWIEEFDSFKNGFNLTCGGDGISLLDHESMKKAREKTNEKLRTKEARERVGAWSSKFHSENKKKMKKVLSENAKSGWSKLSAEERRERALKVWEKRRANKGTAK